MELLPHATSEAQSLQLLHRFGWPIGKRVKGVCGKSKLGDRHATALEREPAEPSDRCALVAIGIAVPQHQADPQRVGKAYLWKLTGRGEDQVGVARFEGASETNVWSAGIAHPNVRSHPGQAGRLGAVDGQCCCCWRRPRPYRLEHGGFGPRPGAPSGGRARAPLPRRGGALDRRDRPAARTRRGTVKAYLYDPSYANKGHYTSLGATRAVYGAPRAESRPGPQQDRTHAAMAWRREPDAHPARRLSARQRWWMGRERSVCGGGLNTGVHATPLEEEQPWR